MKLPLPLPVGVDHEILGEILECSIVDALTLPLGSRIHARWDTIICGEQRTIRETFESNPERGSAKKQIEDYRPIVQSCFESEERARAKYGASLPMPVIHGQQQFDRSDLIRAAAIEECAGVCDELADNNTDFIKETGYRLANKIRALATSPAPAIPAGDLAKEPCDTIEGWTGNIDADTALLLLDRLDVQPNDDTRIEQLEGIVRKLARAAGAGERPATDAPQKHFTAIFRDVTRDEAEAIVNHAKWTAGCWGHALNQRDDALLERDKARTECDAARALLGTAPTPPVISKIDDAFLTAARHAVMALAHAVERNPQYQREYEELSSAIDSAIEQAEPAPRSILTPMPYIVPGDDTGGTHG
ncbi:MAG: hypothetical protein V4764_02890 [Burkholderia sp.]